MGFIWRFIRYSFVSVGLAYSAVVPVVWLKWPASIGSSIYLFVHHEAIAAILALVWPYLAGLVGAVVGRPNQVGLIELAFAKKIGYVSKNAES